MVRRSDAPTIPSPSKWGVFPLKVQLVTSGLLFTLFIPPPVANSPMATLPLSPVGVVDRRLE